MSIEFVVEVSSSHNGSLNRASKLIKMANDGLLAGGNGKKEPQNVETDERNWRADPKDGLRPLKTRKKLR